MNGDVITEGERDWSEVPPHGRQSLRLYCPNGQIAELGNSDNASGRLFQFKVGELRAGVGRTTLAHVIGIVDGPNGECHCAAWDYDQGTLTTFTDNVYEMRYQNVGRLSFEVMGLKDG